MSRPDAKLSKLTAEQQALAMTCLRLAYDLAWKRTRRRPWLIDEFESAAGYWLVRAARAFDPTRDRIAFTTYATLVITRGLNAVTLKEQPKGYREHRGVFPKTLSIACVTANPRTLNVPEPDHPSEDVLAFADQIVRLPARLQRVLTLVFVDGYSFKEVGEAIGVNRSRAQKLYVKAVKLLGATCTKAPTPSELGISGKPIHAIPGPPIPA